jgi:hypothetical protein
VGVLERYFYLLRNIYSIMLLFVCQNFDITIYTRKVIARAGALVKARMQHGLKS